MTTGHKRYNVAWHTPSRDVSGTMPLGNGDLAANVWCESAGPTGDLLIYLSKSDAWSDEARLIKLGRLRISLKPNPWAGALKDVQFHQELRLDEAEIVIRCRPARGGETIIRVWIDAHHPVLRAEVRGKPGTTVRVTTEIWRTAERELTPREAHSAWTRGEFGPVRIYPDVLVKDSQDRLLWYHRNEHSVWRESLTHQGLGELAAKQADPLLHRTFGVWVEGPGLTRSADATLQGRLGKSGRTTIAATAHTAQTDLAQGWLSEIESLAASQRRRSVTVARREHRRWWQAFWDRSFIHATGCPEAELVSRGYALQRYIFACAGRGAFPVKFNGSLFNVDAFEADVIGGQTPAQPTDTNPNPRNPGAPGTPGAPGNHGTSFDADYRMWGGPYWFQNTRLVYWSMLASGDFEMMRPFFRMYLDALPVAIERCRRTFNHTGGYFPETMHFWGTYHNCDYDYTKAGLPDRAALPDNPYIKHYLQSNLELLAVGLHHAAFTGDRSFVRDMLLPLAEPILAFYDQHYPRDERGRLRIEPAQALEMYWEATNPAPDIAGLRRVLNDLLALPAGWVPDNLAKQWRQLLSIIPDLPTRETNGITHLSAAETHCEKASNVENPELYAVFPYRLFGVGLPHLDLARRTYGKRRLKLNKGWHQDAIQAACLGLTDVAERYVVDLFAARHSTSRFPAFWGKNYDWIPDQDHGSVAMIALQNMLLQESRPLAGKPAKLHLLPAWPEDWNVHFRLRASGRRVVEGSWQRGRWATRPTTRRGG